MMFKKEHAEKLSFCRIVILCIAFAMLHVVMTITVFAEELIEPSYFNTENGYALNEEGKVELVFGEQINANTSLVFFTKESDGSFTGGTPIAILSGAIGYEYNAGTAARTMGVTLYAILTDYTSTNLATYDYVVEETAGYVVLAKSVDLDDTLVLQVIEVDPEPTFPNNIVSMTVEKDVSNGGESKYHVMTSDTVVVTLVLKGVTPEVDEINSEVGGSTGTWTSEVLGSGASKSIKWTGTFVVTDSVASNQQRNLDFEIIIIDSFNNSHSVKEDDTTYPVNDMQPVLLLGPFTNANLTFDCDNNTPYESPDNRIIYAGETMKLRIRSSERAVKLVSYRVGTSGQMPVTGTFSNDYTISHILSASECPAGGSAIKVWFTLMDKAGNEREFSLPSVDELIYEESSYPSTVSIEGPDPLYNGNFYVNQGAPLNITVLAAKCQNRSNVTIDIWGNTVTLTYIGRENGKWKYTGTLQLNNCAGYTSFDLLTYSFASSKQSWTSSSIPIEDDVIYLKELTVNTATMKSNNTYDVQYVVDGEMVIATVKFSHTELVRHTDAAFTLAGVVATDKTGITDCELIVPGSNEAIYYYDSVNKHFIVKYTLPVPGETGYQVNVTDDQPIDLLVKAKDIAGNEFTEASVLPLITNPVKYYAPLVVTTEVSSVNGNIDIDGYFAVRNGETYTVTIYSNHLLELSRTALEIIGLQGGNFTLVSSSTGAYIYEAEFTINSAPLDNIADFTVLLVDYTVYDLAGQDHEFDPATDALDDGSWGRYYAPIEITDVVVESSNLKNKTLYAKNGDTITITFTSNHYVDIAGTIAGKPAGISFVAVGNSNNVKWTITYILQNGDLPDLATVNFMFTANDAAKNAEVKYTQVSTGVTNTITYYAPIVATAGIVSNNARTMYAKNGDTLTITCDAQHAVAAVEYHIGRFSFTNPETFANDPLKLNLTIPSGESSMSEGVVMFWIELVDPAGNTLRVEKTTDESQVIYDRTAPEVTFAPAFNGATNDDVYLSIVYSDLYLDLYTVSFMINDFERIPSNLKVNGSEPATTFTHQITVFSEGEYYCTGTISDMAGNKSIIGVSCSFIVDKTNPSVSIKLDPNTFPGGFRLDSIFSADDELLGDTICTVTEDSGVHDWTLNEPMTVEGRKTVLLIATDIAGNYSVPITCDIYIDTTAPQPTVRETTRGTVLGRIEENRITVQNGVLGVSLAAIHMGDEKPDTFTRLELLDEDGNGVANLLASDVSADGLYYVDLPGRGNYTLVMEAEDGVGNKTGAIRYDIIYRPTQWWLIIVLSIAGLMAIVGLGVYIVKRRKESQEF